MNSTEPVLNMAGRYTITETCKLLGLHRHTLRHYTDCGKIRCGIRRGTARKFYTGSEILRFWRAQM